MAQGKAPYHPFLFFNTSPTLTPTLQAKNIKITVIMRSLRVKYKGL